MNIRRPIRDLQIKVHVTAEEKKDLQDRADAAGLSLSRYLSTVGLARQTGVSAERIRDQVNLLELVLSRLNLIAQDTADGTADNLMVLEKLCMLERQIVMLAPFSHSGEQPEC